MKTLVRTICLLFLAASFGCQSASGPKAQAPAQGRVEGVFEKAEKGDAEAQYTVGKYYATGQGVAQDLSTAAKWYRKAAEQGNARAQNNLGECCLFGKGEDLNPFAAVEWFRKSAQQGNKDAQAFLLGLACFHFPGVAGEYTNSHKQLLGLANEGNAVAQGFLGMVYLQGQGVTKDQLIAVQWFRKAAEQGQMEAQAFLGLAYLQGLGVARNYAKGVEWSRKAAEQGDSLGQFNLGVCYNLGRGVQHNEVEAVAWFRKAAEQGNAEAQASLGLAYREGKGVKKDYVEAYKWLDRAAAQGNANAVSGREELLGLMTPAQCVVADAVPRRGLTNFDRRIIDAHEQRYSMSCIPSAVEMVLKLLDRVPGSYYEQQNAWKEKADGSFRDFDGKTIAGVTFHLQFWLPHNADFPLAQLFETIHRELNTGRFVIIGLPSAGDTHDWVIYDEDAKGDFLAISKAQGTIEARHLKKIITDMHGTDIGTYELSR